MAEQAEKYIRNLQKSIMEENKDKTCGEQRDIVVYINHGLDEYDISQIKQIEKYIDEALRKVGFKRSKTINENIQELVYWQFAGALKKDG